MFAGDTNNSHLYRHLLGCSWVVRNFDYLFGVVGVNQTMISKFPAVLTVDHQQLTSRYQYLRKLNLACFNPKDVRYIPLLAFAVEDVKFVEYTRTSIHDFNAFLKTI